MVSKWLVENVRMLYLLSLLRFLLASSYSIPLRAARSSEDSDKTKTWMNACIRIQVFVFVCWTKSRDEIGREAVYECGPQNHMYDARGL